MALGSVCLFVYFTFVNIQSNIINGIAKTTFGIYLIHENTYLSQHLYAWMFDNVVYQWQIIAVGIAIFAICGMLDYIVLRLTNPLYKRIDGLLVRYGY